MYVDKNELLDAGGKRKLFESSLSWCGFWIGFEEFAFRRRMFEEGFEGP